MSRLVLGTAGHIDHGKSALVKALTGTDPDRLAEEQARGITIELGFADLDLGEDRHLSIVDVPGHERFVRHMVAGATGIDAVLLVVSADEGVMPQTREHLSICDLLGVRHGLVALTKSDLVEPDLMEVVALELQEFLEGSFLEEAPVVPVSARSGEGLDDLKERLGELFDVVEIRPDDGVPRLPVDRAFSMRGFGTVVTGTLVAGTLRAGEEIEVLPGGLKGRVRGIQVHGRAVPEVAAGRRTAVNLQGLSCEQVRRGVTLTRPGGLRMTRRAWARIRLVGSVPDSFRKGGVVRFHQGTAECGARVRLLADHGSGEMDGELILDDDAVLIPGDRFILRRPMPVDTLGGGVILDNDPPRGRRAREELARPAGNEKDPLRLRLARAGLAGAQAQELAGDLGLSREQVEARLALLQEEGLAVRLAGRVFAAPALAALREEVRILLDRFHREKPLQQGMPREGLRSRLCRETAQDSWRAFLARLEGEGEIAVRADLIALPSHRVVLSPAEEARARTIEKLLLDGGLDPPGEERVLREAGGGNAAELLNLLVESGRLVRLGDGRPFHAGALEALRARLKEYARDRPTIDVAAFKDLAGVTRKNAIPLLEYLDGERQTRRVGNVREILIR